MRPRIALLTSVLFCALPLAASAQWIKQNVNTTASFRGLSVVNEKVVWASGTGGTVIRTIDGGKTWDVITVPGAEKLDFRDVEAFDANTAYVLSIGNGESSRIYKTIDGGKNWNLQFKNANEKAFFDAIACWNRKKCLVMSDPVDGRYYLIATTDGRTWNPLPEKQLPTANEGEAAFAASGTCLIARGESYYYLVTGGTHARVLESEFGLPMWLDSVPPIAKGRPSSGIFSLAMRGAKNGIVVGGNYEKPSETQGTGAITKTGGTTWEPVLGLTGYRSGVAYVDKRTIVAVGTNGSDLSPDGGKTWKKIGDENLNSVQAKGQRSVWAVGPKGLIVKRKETE